MEKKIFKTEVKKFNAERKWKFCNAKLEPYPHPWSYGDYKCPKCGSTSGMVNALGGCATKVFL